MADEEFHSVCAELGLQAFSTYKPMVPWHRRDDCERLGFAVARDLSYIDLMPHYVPYSGQQDPHSPFWGFRPTIVISDLRELEYFEWPLRGMHSLCYLLPGEWRPEGYDDGAVLG